MNIGRPRSRKRYDVLEALRKDPRASLRELCKATGIKSTSTMTYYLNQLEKEKLIHRRHGARQIYLGPKPDQVELSEKRTRAARLGRGVDALKSKKDPRLQARIDEVVEKALRAQQSALGGQADVVRGERWFFVKGSLGACKVG